MPSTTHPITKAMNPTEKPARSIGDKQASISEIPEIYSMKYNEWMMFYTYMVILGACITEVYPKLNI